MHILQAFKMALKSLWTNKLRSFLTMLGIIIGVFAVSLLTTVAQGVSDAVVSQIKSQSTLAVYMNMSNRLKNKEATDIVKSVQPTDANADDYFDFSLVNQFSSLVASADLETLNSEGVLDYLTATKIYTKRDFPNYDSTTDEEKQYADIMMATKKGSVYTNVMVVSSNYDTVYDLKYKGEFPKTYNEILINDEFAEVFLKLENENEAIGKFVTFGVKNYTEIKYKFSENVPESLRELYFGTIEKMMTEKSDDKPLSLTVIKNDDGSTYVYDEEKYTLTFNVEIYKYATNAELLSYINAYIENSSFNGKITAEIQDIYDTSMAKEYKVVGVLESEDSTKNSEQMNQTSESMGMQNYNYLNFSSNRGTCYMLSSDENVTTLYGKTAKAEDTTVSYIYFRYKDESVMTNSTTNIILAFATNGNYEYLSDFALVSYSSVAKIISKIMDILTIMLTVISVISLIVGGIGIMNIMLVAVSERTREIGIRKAIGAKRGSILTQFLVEALTLSVLGGLIGLGLSWIGTIIISNVMNIKITIPLWVVGMSVGFCTAIGLIFGMFPAIKASNMQPIDALRRE